MPTLELQTLHFRLVRLAQLPALRFSQRLNQFVLKLVRITDLKRSRQEDPKFTRPRLPCLMKSPQPSNPAAKNTAIIATRTAKIPIWSRPYRTYSPALLLLSSDFGGFQLWATSGTER